MHSLTANTKCKVSDTDILYVFDVKGFDRSKPNNIFFQNAIFSCNLSFVGIKTYPVVPNCPFTHLCVYGINGIILCDSFKLTFVTLYFKFHVSTVRLEPRQTGFTNSDHLTMTFDHNFYCFNWTLAYFLLVFSSSTINCLDLWDHCLYVVNICKKSAAHALGGVSSGISHFH